MLLTTLRKAAKFVPSALLGIVVAFVGTSIIVGVPVWMAVSAKRLAGVFGIDGEGTFTIVFAIGFVIMLVAVSSLTRTTMPTRDEKEQRKARELEQAEREEAPKLERQAEQRTEEDKQAKSEADREQAEWVERKREEARQAQEMEEQEGLWQGTGGPPKPGPNWIRRTWPNEARDFTPWLAEHLELVSACTGWDLRFEGREVYAAGGRVDIVARGNKSKSKVVIENQLDSADFEHWRQLVFYGDTLNARIRIWIAADFSPNIRRDVRNQNRQNESRSDGAIYYLLKLRPDQISPISLVEGPRNSQATRISAFE